MQFKLPQSFVICYSRIKIFSNIRYVKIFLHNDEMKFKSIKFFLSSNMKFPKTFEKEYMNILKSWYKCGISEL